VSSLIQSKTVESRYWGICLAKASVTGGGEGVGHTVVWAKLLTSLLNVLPRSQYSLFSDQKEVSSWRGLYQR
jgi:hypothetical protein